MKLLAINDLVLEDAGINVDAGHSLITKDSSDREWTSRNREGIAGQLFFGNVAEPAIWNAAIKCPDEESMDSIIAVLSGDVENQHRLLAERLDLDATRVITSAAVRTIRQLAEFSIEIELESENAAWRDETPTLTEKTFSSILDQSIKLNIPGNTKTRPIVTLTPTAQRSDQTPQVGYKWRRRFTITNNSDDPWLRLLLRVDLGSTTAHVSAGRALASGWDVRLVESGVEQPRELVSWNSAASFLWFVLSKLDPGDSITYDIISGNPEAVNPATLEHPSTLVYPDLPPITLSSSSNASWVYPMTTDGAGAWRLSQSTAPAGADFSVPGAWRRALTSENPSNPDWSFVASYHPPDALVGAAIRAKFRAERHPAKYAGILKANPYDGVEIYHPLGISSITANFQWTNPNSLGTLVILARESAADPWTAKHQHSATAASATAHAPGAQSFSPPVRHVACAIWPDNGWEMPLDSEVVGATAWWDTALSIAIDTTNLGISIESAWTEVYELATTLRVRGGGNAIPPYHELLVGNADQEDGAGVTRALVTLSQGLRVDAFEYEHEVWSNDGSPDYDRVALIENLSAHAVDAVKGFQQRSVAVEVVTSEWLPLVPKRPSLFDAFSSIDAWASGSMASRDGMTLLDTYGPIFNSIAISAPGQIASDASGNFYIADGVNGRIVKINSSGAYVSAITGLTSPHGVAVDPSGNVYTLSGNAGSANSQLRKYNASFAVQWTVSEPNVSTLANAHLATDGTHVWVAYDSAAGAAQVSKRLCTTGAVVSFVGTGPGSGDGQFSASGNTGILLSGGELYVVDQGNNRIQVFNASTDAYVRKWAINSGARGIAVDGSGNIWVAEHANDQLRRFSNTGVLQETITQVDPSGVVVVSSSIWVTNAGNGTVAKWSDVTTTSSFTWNNAVAVGDALGAAALAIVNGLAGDTMQMISDAFIEISEWESVDVVATVRSSSANLTPRLQLLFYDAADNLISTVTEDDWTPVAGARPRRGLAARAPKNATQYRVAVLVVVDVHNTTATAYVDDVISGGDSDLFVSEVASSSMKVEVEIPGRWT